MEQKGSLETANFQVFGKVQGVYFRKYTQIEADKLGLGGWVMNTTKGTVIGTIQGPSEKLKLMKNWLSLTGSPNSKIEKCEFDKEGEIKTLTFKSFDVRR